MAKATTKATTPAKEKPTTARGYDPFNGLVERIGEAVTIHRKGITTKYKSVKEAEAAMKVAIANAVF